MTAFEIAPVTSDEAFASLFSPSDDDSKGAGPARLVVVDLHMEWSGPTVVANPLFSKLWHSADSPESFLSFVSAERESLRAINERVKAAANKAEEENIVIRRRNAFSPMFSVSDSARWTRLVSTSNPSCKPLFLFILVESEPVDPKYPRPTARIVDKVEGMHPPMLTRAFREHYPGEMSIR